MSFISILAATTVARTAINSLRRTPYAIMTDLAAALGLPRQAVETAMALQWSMGVFGPLFGAFIDRNQRKQIMLAALGAFVLLTALGALASWAGLAVGVVLGVIVLAGLCKTVYDPAMQAYISDNTPQARRGVAIGITETAWSLALVIFAPLGAFLITHASVGWLFAVIAASGAAAWVLIWRLLPQDHVPARSGAAHTTHWRTLLGSRGALMLLVATACQSMAGEVMAIGYEAWFKQTFSLSVGVLASLTLYISAAEFGGEFSVVGLADRLGRRRLALIMLSVCAGFCLALPQAGASLPLAVALMVGMFLTFEASMVSVISLATDVLPQARGTMMTSLLGALAISRAFGTVVGGAVLRTGGYTMNGALSMALNIAAALLIWAFVGEIMAARQPAA